MQEKRTICDYNEILAILTKKNFHLVFHYQIFQNSVEETEISDKIFHKGKIVGQIIINRVPRAIFYTDFTMICTGNANVKPRDIVKLYTFPLVKSDPYIK